MCSFQDVRLLAAEVKPVECGALRWELHAQVQVIMAEAVTFLSALRSELIFSMEVRLGG